MATVVPDDGSEGAGAERRLTRFGAYLCEECELSVQIYARIVRNVHNIHLSSVLERSGATRKILRQNVTSVKIRHTILHVGPDIRNVFRKPAHVEARPAGSLFASEIGRIWSATMGGVVLSVAFRVIGIENYLAKLC